LHLHLALDRRHVDLGAERGLREADRDVAHDVVALAPEDRVLADVQHNVEIARRRTVVALLALAAELETRAGVDSGRDAHAQSLRRTRCARAAAGTACVAQHRAEALTLSARLRDREESLLVADLTAAAAGAARLARFAVARPEAGTRLARNRARNGDRLLGA